MIRNLVNIAHPRVQALPFDPRADVCRPARIACVHRRTWRRLFNKLLPFVWLRQTTWI
jgi:hypothetical protein